MAHFYPARLGFKPLPTLQLLWFSVLLTAPLTALAQQRTAVSGTVGSSTGAPIEYATVTLHRAADSTVVKTEFSNGQGAFRLEAAGGSYLVSAVQVGYGRYWSPAFELTAEGLTLPGIKLTASRVTALKEVKVTARKPLFEHLADRTVVNVADSPLSAGSTTLDVLSRAPGVTVSTGDVLGLRGRTGLLVVIDGKRTPLTGTELADYLRSLPAEQLQSIELITNPPAQYDAQGGAGVIAINLKKDQRLGTNGSVNAGYGRGEYGKFTTGLALNHRRKNLNVYGNYAYADRRGFFRHNFNRQYAESALLPAASSVLANEQLTHLRSHTGKVGLDVNLSKRTTLGISASGLASETNSRTANNTQLFGAQGETTSRFTSLADQDLNRPSVAANLYFRHAFADSATARTLSADADIAQYRTTRLLALNTYYEQPAYSPRLLSGDQGTTLTIKSVKTDFSAPLPYRARLEAGAKVTRIISDNNVAFVRTANGMSALDPAISNQFRYEENVNAAYVSVRRATSKSTLQAGLRAEQTNTLAATVGSTSRERHYFQLFPSALLQRTLNERHGLALSVARRIDRPSYGQLNPLRAYSDASSYRAGNPDLQLQTSYNIELTHMYRQKFSTTLTYAQTDQPIVSAVQLSEDGGRLVVNRDANLKTQHTYSLALDAPFELAKWWTLNANGVVYYSRFQGTLAGTPLDRGQPAFTLAANNSFGLSNGWTAELNGNFQSGEIWGFEVSRARGQVAAGVQKSLWEKQGTLRLNMADIFYTMPGRATSTYYNFSESFRVAQDTRVVTASLTYRFGNSKVAAARKRTVGADDELRRAGQ
ncbi:hypothetical protein AUC43_14805 [Hymenobacter sedentarius]|uniref:Outer membrane protein beta-barrel domain-containing protein n=1 Tax=Hymenobacter sedentarius TaxID=1411621 RepID=A0A0U3SJE8_9BACT|nr:TonB-dependent receptor [Hymenobacter sedentarius]ALW86244.1 hypothetical protein AUC43_14805 [Hymenobacter sedentarius]